VLAALVGVKAAYWMVVAAMVGLWTDFDTERAAQIFKGWFPAGWPPAPRGEWERHFTTWDAEHYLYLSAAGYPAEARSIAFYPLWPLVIRAGAALTGLSHLATGLVLANLCSLAGWLLFHRVAARRWGERVADAALALLVVFPGALFFQFVYSESLFFLLLMGLWWALEQRRHAVAWVAAALAPLVRGVGVFAVLPLAWHIAQEHAWGARLRRLVAGLRPGRKKTSQPGDPISEIRNPKSDAPSGGTPLTLAAERTGLRPSGSGPLPWTLLLAPLAGWGGYLGLMAHWTGDPWAGVEAQRFWGVHAVANLGDLPKFVAGFFEVSAWHAYRGSLLDRLGFLLLLYSLPVQWRLGKDLLAWSLMLGVLPAMSGTFTSFVRFEACAFPVFLGLAGFFTVPRWKGPGLGFLLVCLGLHGLLLWRFLNYRWAG
jgi:hypothetical protein